MRRPDASSGGSGERPGEKPRNSERIGMIKFFETAPWLIVDREACRIVDMILGWE
jgi:hypothetical protein